MATPEELLAILTATKLFDGTVWRAYDVNGVELAGSDLILAKGTHGALLTQAALFGLPSVAGVVEGMGFTKAAQIAAWADETANLASIHFEDQLASELLIALVTKGFFNGAFHT
jgi:hypothetical protein